MNRIFKTRIFIQWANKMHLSDDALCQAVVEMSQGLIDANLGGGVFKKRIALPGQGKSGGFRTLVATNRGDRWFFVFGFAKNERTNINRHELTGLQKLAYDLLKLSNTELEIYLCSKTLGEICHDRFAT